MAVSGIILFIGLAFVLLFIVGVIALQIYLSKSESKWPGLVLPIISLIVSIFMVLSILAFTIVDEVGTTTVTNFDENEIVTGETFEETFEEVDSEPLADIAGISISFLIYNIPTAVLLVIYGSVRSKKGSNSEMKKMNIQDL